MGKEIAYGKGTASNKSLIIRMTQLRICTASGNLLLAKFIGVTGHQVLLMASF
jgi:hypothetical protein